MLLTFYLLFIVLHVSEGCNLVNREQVLDITAHTGGSVLLPCYCTDLQTTPEGFRWNKDNTKIDRREEISSGSGQYRDRVQLFNGHSPGNLSLLISHLTEEDGGIYWCDVRDSFIIIRLTLKGCNLVNREQVLDITAHTGGSVLLPCYCTDLQTTPEGFRWNKDNTKTDRREEISSGSGQYRDRVQLVNGHSPGNLSLLISHLTEEDGGIYWCDVRDSFIIIRLTLKECPKSLPYIPFAVITVIVLHIIVAVVYLITTTKDPARGHYSTADGDGVVSLE
ncbi:polymeric immunoglobulin receptor-like [Pygocentrus nattereri]|uniref:polymeric immunoglobulin receptor-like n=1 Tax=Pygocentrus nattereri TaxID=42514 RepID=UPI0018911F6D|nr:polymeric immunoglobulin receptor-like [Pygocentrus nattereri]